MRWPTIRFDDDEPDPVIDALNGYSERVQENVTFASLSRPLPEGWHYEATFPPINVGATFPAQLTYTIEAVPDDPLIAALVLREE